MTTKWGNKSDMETEGGLPEHVQKTEDGYSCMHCGGEVSTDGFANAPEDMDSNDEEPSEQAEGLDVQFAKAVKKGRR